jgi:hypothetical protein
VSPPRRPTCGRVAVPWTAPTHVAAAPLPTPRFVLPLPSPWCASQPIHHLELAHKKGRRRPSSRDAAPPSRHCRRPWCHGEPVLWPLAPPNRAAPIFLLLHESLHARLLTRPSRRLAGAKLPAAAATGLRRARPPALSLPQVSAQTESSQPLAPLQPLPCRARRRGRQNCSWPRRPQAPGTSLQGPTSF